MGADKKSHKITIAMDDQEYELARIRAGRCGLPLASFIRDSSLKTSIVERIRPEENRLLKDLYKVGTNLNQLMQKLNSQQDYRYDSDLSAIITEFGQIREFYRRIRDGR